jgi:outer membrane lipoprotein SlyB
MTNNLLRMAVASIAALVLAGCAGSQSGSAYSHSQTRGEMTGAHGGRGIRAHGDHRGQPFGQRAPLPEERSAALPAAISARAGARRSVPSSGQWPAASAGQAIEERTSKKDGLEITIKLDSGQIIAVTQEADEAFRAGDRVRVLSGSGATRVSH